MAIKLKGKLEYERPKKNNTYNFNYTFSNNNFYSYWSDII